jgi:1-acyl-sn-glycerol-3-phosphate acyltransferase
VRARWNGAAAVAPPPPTFADRVRLWLRAPVAVLWFLGCFTAFMALRPLDRLLGRAGTRALAPSALGVWARGTMWLIGLRVSVTGAPMRTGGALVANHSSWLDIVALRSAAPVYFVSKAEVADWPVIGFVGQSIGTEFIERRPTEARRQADALGARLAAGDALCIFPEGTSSDGQRVLPFKSSLFSALVDAPAEARVQPVTLRYHPEARLPASFYGWWGEMDFGTHLKAVLAYSRAGRVDITFHTPLDPAEFAHRKGLSASADAAVRRGFGPEAGA